MTALEQCLAAIPYAQYLGLKPDRQPAGAPTTNLANASTVVRFRLQGEEKLMGNPILRAWHGGVLSGTLQTAMSATLMATNNLTEPPDLCEWTTRYVSSSPIDKPLTIEVRIVRLGRRVQFLEAQAWQVPETIVATAQASFRGQSSS